MDIGSSTGGFTDCLLQAGARKVIAIDVGYGLLDYRLRKDPRVELHERTNFRHMDLSQLSEKPDVVTVDLSFISLAKIMAPILECLTDDGRILTLVKPQFEGTPKEAPGGFVRDEATRQLILKRTEDFFARIGLNLLDRCDSSLKGRKGNQETFFLLQRA